MKNTFVFLLAGGEGKRLGLLTRNRPKPLVPFAGNYRLIDFPLSNAANSGVKQLGVLVQASQRSIINYVENGSAWGFRRPASTLWVLSSNTPDGNSQPYAGTADAVRRNMARISDDPECDTVLILSSDHVYQMDYRKLISYHRRRKADVTVGVTHVAPSETKNFGIVDLDRNKRIVNWQEKPLHSSSTLASMGIYVFSKKYLLQAFDRCQGTDFGHHVIPYACRHAAIIGYVFSGYWRDVGNPTAYWQANMDLLDYHKNIKIQKWKIKTNRQPVTETEPQRLDVVYPAAFENSIVSERAHINGRALRSIIFPGVHIDKNVTVRNSIIMSDCTIAPNSSISNSILCDKVQVGEGSVIGPPFDAASFQARDQSRKDGLIVIGEDMLIKPNERISHSFILLPQQTDMTDHVQENPRRHHQLGSPQLS